MCLAIPAKVQSAEGDGLERTGKVDFGGVMKNVSLAYVPEAKIGDFVIVHAGFAISVMAEDEAKETFEYLRLIEEAAQIKAPGA